VFICVHLWFRTVRSSVLEEVEKSMPDELPNIGAAIAPVLQRVPREQQPLLIAFAERLAAERYRGWAGKVDDADQKAALLACAAREEEIASRIERLYPRAESTQQDLLAANPDLLDINSKLFASLTLEQQFRVQAQGERLGAATWRAFAKHATEDAASDVFLACALLEEESAELLESLVR
jgi:hypothetical protein